MIYYLVAEKNAGEMYQFLSTWGKALANRVTIVPYERVFSGERVRLPAGTYIFSSVRGSDPASPARQEAGRLYRELAESFGAERVINDPLSFMRRFDLLQALHARGINRFGVYRAGGPETPRRFPVFLRPEPGTKWDAPPLLKNAEEYHAAVGRAGDLTRLLAIEFCDASDASGIYRKYACFVVGNIIVPRHLFFSRNWWVKQAELCEPGMVEEELAFLESNPHAKTLLEVCRVANIGYGRIDYAVLEGQPQIWEINVTPLIAGGLSSEISARRPVHLKFVALFSAALDAVDPDGS